MTRLLPERVSPFSVALLVLGAVALMAAAAWIAGAFFLVVSGAASVRSASPLTLYSYWYWYAAANPRIEAWCYLSALVGVLVLIAPVAPLLMPRPAPLHGNAKWARAPIIRRAGLFGNRGFVVAQWRGRLLRHGGTPLVSPHVFLAAPTGSGKTQGVMLPNALTWPGSMIALDTKGELHARTAGYRAKHGQKIFALNFTPRNYRSHCYNPFSACSQDPNFLVADVQRVIGYLIQLGKGDDFWPLQARQIAIGLALYFYSLGEVPTLPKIRSLAMMGANGEGLQKWCRSLMQDQTKIASLHPEARRALTSFAVSAENTAAGIAQTVMAGLAPFVNDLTAAVVSESSFDLAKLREEAITIYVIVNPADMKEVSPILRLFFQQAVDLNIDVEFGKNPRHRFELAVCMDEFATVGKVPAIEQGIPYIRSYGIWLLAICQSPAQMSALYETHGAKAFIDNFGCSIFFTPASQDVSGAEHVSRVLGNQTVTVKSTSQRGGWAWGGDGRSETSSLTKRPLMLPQEVLRLPIDEAIVVISGTDPILARKPLADRDPRFQSRFSPAPEIPMIHIAPTVAPSVTAPLTRPVDQEDLAQLDALDLSDFSLDFSDVELPKESISEEEVEALCKVIYDRVMTPAESIH